MENEVYQAASAGASVLNSASGWNGTPVAIVFALLFVGFCIIVLRYLLKSSDRSNEIIAKNSESNFALKAAIENSARVNEKVLENIDKKADKLLSLHEKTHEILRNLDKRG